MSTRKGATVRDRPQTHQNRTAFKNDLHDKSVKTKVINSIQIAGVCSRCKDIIAWKIKYKKYKPLTAPRKCVQCDQKSVKKAYHVMCHACAREADVCAKCLKKEEVVEAPDLNTPKEDEDLQAIKNAALPERQRRTLLRFLQKRSENPMMKNDDFAEKLERLKLACKNENDSGSFNCGSSEEEFSCDD